MGYFNQQEALNVKQPKKPVRWQKEVLTAHNLNAKHWAVVSESEFYVKFINKETGRIKTLDKFRREKKKW